ncbi:hypothetical protein O3P69_019134 [Scylla paramamosain]|uniref:Uncharacterized protein n=1 Tax=Scylla paramamosain TaxID=85552 RepID=A0AAW0SVW1_SCYPA
MTSGQVRMMEKLLVEYVDMFSRGNHEIGRTSLVQHSINTADSLIKQPPRRHSMSRWYQQRTRDVQYAVGDHVWLFNPRRRRGLAPKFQSHCEGPYTVLQPLSGVTYRISGSAQSEEDSSTDEEATADLVGSDAVSPAVEGVSDADAAEGEQCVPSPLLRARRMRNGGVKVARLSV